jgi:hypothetical protein
MSEVALNGKKMMYWGKKQARVLEGHGSAAAIFAPSNRDCYDHYSRISGYKQTVCAQWCRKIVIRLS